MAPSSASALFLLMAAACAALAQAVDTASHTATSILQTTSSVHVSMGILAALAIAAGIVVCLGGYRLFRLTIFFCGFVVGGVVVASIVEFVFSNKSWLVTASWIGFGVGGLLVGLFAVSLYTTSLFIAGAAAGVLLAFTLQTSGFYRLYPAHPNYVLLGLAVGLGLLGGILALKLERPVLIVATSFVGAAVTVWGIGYFVGDFPNAADLQYFAKETVDKKWVYSIPQAWWGYLAGLLVLFGIGLMAQFGKTSKNYSYKPAKSSNSQAAWSHQSEFDQVLTPEEDHRPKARSAINYV